MHLPALADVLERLSLSDRATMATVHACPDDELSSRLVDVRHWQQMYVRLPHAARSILERIRRAGGKGTTAWIDGIAGPLRSNVAVMSPRTLLSIYTDHTALETLFVWGLLWSYATPKGEMWGILPEIEAVLPAPLPIIRSETYAIDGADNIPSLDDIVCRVACVAFDGHIPLQHHGKVSQVVLQRLTHPAVTLPYLQWLVASMLAGGACIAEHNHVVPTQTMLVWLGMSTHVRSQEITRAWLQAAWSEWEMGPKRRPPALDVRAARRAVLHELLPHLPDSWCALTDIRQQLKDGWPDIFRDERTKLTVGWRTRWDDDDGQLLMYLLGGPLCWLGVLESANDGMFVRRTALGRWLAGIAPAPHAAVPLPAVLEADYSVVLPDATNILARFQLHRIATWTDAMTAQLSPQRVTHALAKGMTINEYCAIVQQIVAPAPPDEMLGTIRRWGAAVAHVHLTPMVLIHASDPAVVHDIVHDRRVAIPTHTWIGDAHVGIDPADAPALARRLRTAGYVVETARLRPAAFSDDELALIESALQQLDAQSDAARQLHARVAQLRATRSQSHHG